MLDRWARADCFAGWRVHGVVKTTDRGPHMPEKISSIVRIATITCIVLAISIAAAAALELITAEEAALPDATGINVKRGVQTVTRAVTRGPKVLVVSPASEATLRSPLNLQLRFETHGGAVIEPRSVAMTYLKKPTINLTPRIYQFIKAGGIDLNNAELPPGTHYFRVDVEDNGGRLGSTTFALTVAE
jgi:hypothetical protein